MTQEEKAKRYDELLLKLQKAKVDDNVCDEMYYRVIDDIVPELKESEDEKIRKVLIDYFKRYKEQEECGIKTFYGIPADDILAWLEKQGTQPRYNIGDVICDKLCTTLNKEAQPNMAIVDIQNGMYICDKGSFPVSQQDEYVLVSKKIDMKPVDSVSNELRTASIKYAEKEILNPTFHDNKEFELAYTFEEGAKWDAAQKPTWSEKHIADVFEKVGLAKIVREQSNDALTIALQDAMIELSKVTLQPNPTTWSEEDEEILNLIIARLQSHADVDFEEYSKEYDWLNSPKARPTWKPSDEQMAVLNEVINYAANSELQHWSNVIYTLLKSLREQLKKLKGE